MVNMLSHPRHFGRVLRKLSSFRRLPQFSTTPCWLDLFYLNPTASRAEILHGVLQGSNVVELGGNGNVACAKVCSVHVPHGLVLLHGVPQGVDVVEGESGAGKV